LLSEYGEDFMSHAPVALLEKICSGEAKSRDEEVIILSQVLACDATMGYEDHANIQVRAAHLRSQQDQHFCICGAHIWNMHPKF
jgi:hypothetical protein